jgi:MFS family permease
VSALLARALPEPREPRDPGLTKKDLRLSVLDGAGSSMMVGLGETYISAFALALGMGQISAGLISSVPLIAGGVLQLAAPFAVKQLGSYRRWVVWCTALQACAFLPLMLGALYGAMPTFLVFFVVSLYWGSGMASGAAWNTWIETLVPKRVRARYFSRRARICHAVFLAALLIGGTVLHAGSKIAHPLYAFAVLFFIAFAARATSSRLLARHSEPASFAKIGRRVPLNEIIPKLRGSREGKLLIFLMAMQVAVQISGPYFIPYWLGHLKLSYLEFTALQVTALAAKLIGAPIFGEVARRTGAHRLLKIGGWSIVPIAALYIFSDSFGWMLFVQVCSGLAWSAYELATLLILFEAIPREERVSLLSLHNFGNACAIVTGSLLGATIARQFHDLGHAYVALFLISSAGRAATTLLLRRIPDGSATQLAFMEKPDGHQPYSSRRSSSSSH